VTNTLMKFLHIQEMVLQDMTGNVPWLLAPEVTPFIMKIKDTKIKKKKKLRCKTAGTF